MNGILKSEKAEFKKDKHKKIDEQKEKLHSQHKNSRKSKKSENPDKYDDDEFGLYGEDVGKISESSMIDFALLSDSIMDASEFQQYSRPATKKVLIVEFNEKEERKMRRERKKQLKEEKERLALEGGTDNSHLLKNTS